MKKGYVYTIVFMLIVSALCTLLLAGTNYALKDKTNQNAVVAERRALLEAFDLPSEGTNDEVSERFEQAVKPAELAGMEGYQWEKDGQVAGLAVPFEGSGLWGTIRGYLAVTPDLSEVLGLVFTEQNETPGLGGRIDEAPFKEQFRGIKIGEDNLFSYGNGDNQVDAVTGATLTSNALLNILNRVLTETLPQITEVK